MKKGVVAVLSMAAGAVAGALGSGKIAEKEIEQKAKKVDKFKSYYNMLNQWLILKQEGKNLEKYFVDNGYKEIAIYGMGEMGNRLYDELKNTSVKVRYAIDKNASGTYADIDVREPEEELKDVDAIIITPIFAFEEIEEELSGKVNLPIISLEDIVYEV